MKCIRCRPERDATGPDHLCDDCRALLPRRDGLPDLTRLHMQIIKPKPFVDENGVELKNNPPLNQTGFWHKPAPDELWAQKGTRKHERNVR